MKLRLKVDQRIARSAGIGAPHHMLAAFAAALALSLAISALLVYLVEQKRQSELIQALGLDDAHWATIQVDGTQVRLSGIAPDIDAYHIFVSRVLSETDPGRILNNLSIRPAEGVNPPEQFVRFIHRDGTSYVFGNFPAQEFHSAAISAAREASIDGQVVDFGQLRASTFSEIWTASFEFGIFAYGILPSPEIYIQENRVDIYSAAASFEERVYLEALLEAELAESIELNSVISSPVLHVSPYVVRIVRRNQEYMLEECHAEDLPSIEMIEKELERLKIQSSVRCEIALGAPSSNWSDAVVTSLQALLDLKGDRLVINDARIQIDGSVYFPTSEVSKVVEAVEHQLGRSFEIVVNLPESPPETEDPTIERDDLFRVSKSATGELQIEGAIADAMARSTVLRVAEASIFPTEIQNNSYIDPESTVDWLELVVPGVRALGRLHSGEFTASRKGLVINGVATSEEVEEQIARSLGNLPGQDRFELYVQYDETINAPPKLPGPEACLRIIENAITGDKITFTPGSSKLTGKALILLQQLAKHLRNCAHVQIEIAGHTDNQGRESMNLELSQLRAQNVLDALLEAGLLTKNMRAKGYGETQPIANNETEEGRELNRRIVFQLFEDKTADQESVADLQEAN